MDSYSGTNKHLTDSKTRAREAAIATFVSQKPGASILTFPGVNYLTEIESLRKRPDLEFIGLESKRDVFVKGLYTYEYAREEHKFPDRAMTQYNIALEVFTQAYRNRYTTFHSSWLDFVGGVTPDRNRAIQEVWFSTLDTMILTISYRTPYSNMADSVRLSGGMHKYFNYMLPCSLLVQEFKYNHGAQSGATFHHMEFKKQTCLQKKN